MKYFSLPARSPTVHLCHRHDGPGGRSNAKARRLLEGSGRQGTAIAFGPVADPKGGWGVGIIAVGDDDELRHLQNGDPAIRADIGIKYEVYPMSTVMVGARL